MAAADNSYLERLERSLDKLSGVLDKHTEILHAIQLEQVSVKASLTQLTQTTAETRALASLLEKQMLELNEWRGKTDSFIMDQGGLKDQLKLAQKDIADLQNNKRDGIAVFRFLRFAVAVVIGAPLLFGAIAYFIQLNTPSPPSSVGLNTNSTVKSIERKIDQIDGE